MAARVFIIICCILAPLSVISILSNIFVNEKLKKRIYLLPKILATASFINGIIAVRLGIGMAEDVIKIRNAVIGESCILAIVALVLNLIGAVITCFMA
ncbi:unnamed protein product [Adineta steineri]|uniref:Uncharacterized protein n=1 Tax=Adineta steineri TaxID=433720 RepID=A0A820A5C1_9BILA|nr:unnamed protein product [Adineta steineri]